MGSSTKTASNLSPDTLTESQFSFWPIIDHLRTCIFILDEHAGKILEANPAALDLLGYSRKELVGRSIWEIAFFKTIIPTERTFRDISGRTSYYTEMHSFETKNGAGIYAEVFMDPYHEGNMSMVVCQINLITDRTRPGDMELPEPDTRDAKIQEQRQELERLQKQLDGEIAQRRRWTQHLHDAVNQPLFSAGLIAEVLPRLWERDQIAAHRSLEDLRRFTFGAMAEMRVLLAESRNAVLVESDLADLVDLLGHAASGRLNIPVSVETKGKVSLPGEVQIALYHLCKEVLNIIAQRAKALRIEIAVVGSASKTAIHIIEAGDTFEIPAEGSMPNKDFQAAFQDAESCGAVLENKPRRDGSAEVVIRWKKRSA